MEILKLTLLLFAYSLGIATLIVQIISYLKDLEYKETIFFTVIFLLLIITSTFQSFAKNDSSILLYFNELATNILTVIFATSIPINIHKERVDKYRKIRNIIVFIFGAIIITLLVLFHSFNQSVLTILFVSGYLYLSVVYSMLFVLFTKPNLLIMHREKTERLMAVGILVIMTITLTLAILNSHKISLPLLQHHGGIVLAIVCIFLSLSKILSDIKKLVQKQEFVITDDSKLYTLGLTQREREVLQLLIIGKTYKEIASSLFISLPTVKTHVSNIYSKAKVRNRLELSNLLRK